MSVNPIDDFMTSRWRSTATPEEDDPDDGTYRAFGKAKAESLMLDLRRKNGTRTAISLRLLLAIEYSAECITLAFPDRLVTVQGQNLDQLYKELMDGKVRFIQEYNNRKWKEPDNKNPVILKIE